jgi:hypothetical protein
MGSVRDQLVHILRCEQGWIGRLQYLPVKELEYKEYPTTKQIRETKARVTAETIAYLDQLSEAQLLPNSRAVRTIGEDYYKAQTSYCITSSLTPFITKDKSSPCSACSVGRLGRRICSREIPPGLKPIRNDKFLIFLFCQNRLPQMIGKVSCPA